MFLKLDGVQGESKAASYKGDIEISSFSFGDGSRQATGGAGGAGPTGGAGGAGRTSFSSFTITKRVDKTSPLLQLGSLVGKTYKEADVFFARKAGGGQQKYLEMKIEDVFISSYKTNGASGGAIPTETVVLDGIKGEATFITANSQSTILLKPQGAA